jgi:hypothetical protein
MNLAYAIPGLAALFEWSSAAALFAIGWYWMKSGLNRFGDSLAVSGLVTAAGGAVWLVWDRPPNLALVQSSLTTGLAVSALVIYVIHSHRRAERLSAFSMLIFAISVQVLAVVLMFGSGAQIVLPEAFLPLWMALRTLTGLAGYGALAVSAVMILLIFALGRMKERLSVDQWAAGLGLRGLEWRSWQIALVALSISISTGLLRAWWGTGQVLVDGIRWALITWLLVAASAVGLMQGGTRSRLARILLVLACVVGVVSVLAMAGPLAVTSPPTETGQVSARLPGVQ